MNVLLFPIVFNPVLLLGHNNAHRGVFPSPSLSLFIYASSFGILSLLEAYVESMSSIFISVFKIGKTLHSLPHHQIHGENGVGGIWVSFV